MDRISGLPDELLAKILSLVPTKVAVSTSVLSKRWEFLWMWVPKIEFVINHDGADISLRDFITKNLPLLKAPNIESFRIQYCSESFQPEDIYQWIGITVSRCISELDINCYDSFQRDKHAVSLPSSLYTCKSLKTLKLQGCMILVDVPRTVSLPSLKTLLLKPVTYQNEDYLQLLLSYCPVLEDLVIYRVARDNVKRVVVISPSLQRLTLVLYGGCLSDEYVIVAPSLKYFKVDYYAECFSFWVAHMPNVEEADLLVDEDIERLFESITSVKRLSLCMWINNEDKYMYNDGIYFSQLEELKLCIRFDYWSKLLFRILRDTPKLRVLNLYTDVNSRFKKYEPGSWNNNQGIVPECLLDSLETFEFKGYSGRQEERDVVSFVLKNACRLKSSSITPSSNSLTVTSSSITPSPNSSRATSSSSSSSSSITPSTNSLTATSSSSSTSS